MELQHSAMATRILYTLIAILTLSSVSTAACLRGMKAKARFYRPATCNSTILDPDIMDKMVSPITTIVVPTFYTAVFVLGVPANGIAFWVLAFKTKKMPSTLLLLNLAVTDLFFMLALPFKITYHFLGNNWIFGETLCRVVTYIFYGNMYCSTLFLMGISIDRYFALVYPFSAQYFRRWRVSIMISISFWLVVAAGISPFLIVPQVKTFERSLITTCHEVWVACKDYSWYTKYFIGLFTVGFAIPLMIISFCYLSILVVLIRKKESYRHVMKLIVLVFLSFVLCFTPSNVLLILHYLENNWECHNELYLWYTLSLALTSLNSCIDPFIYYYVSQDFWTIMKNTLCCGNVKHSEASESTQKSKLATSSDNKEVVISKA
ncbi:proteinase-activated receptor 3-like [Discoglossus pictus]